MPLDPGSVSSILLYNGVLSPIVARIGRHHLTKLKLTKTCSDEDDKGIDWAWLTVCAQCYDALMHCATPLHYG